MDAAIEEIRSRLQVAGAYGAAISNADEIDPSQDLRKLALGVEEVVAALDRFILDVLPRLERASEQDGP